MAKKEKASSNFKKVIEKYLTTVKTAEDFTFVAKLEQKDRNIDDCISYILNKVKKSGVNGFTDKEVFDMAVEYYEKEKIDPKEIGKIGGRVVVNHKVAKTSKPKADKNKAIKIKGNEVVEESKEESKEARVSKKSKKPVDENQISLF